MLQGQAAYGGRRAQVDAGVIGLGRNLFALLPEDIHDHRPLSHANFHLVADLRLDNREELADRLGLATNEQNKLCDSALLFKALIKWGETSVNYLVGEFAFAFWDAGKEELLLGRDILGLRPLYYHRAPSFFGFASMPSGLHALPEIPYDFDPEFMVESLALVPHRGSRSHFKDVQRVEPAHMLRVTRSGSRAMKYWHPQTPADRSAKCTDYEEGLRDVLDRAVKAQLRGSGAIVASHLSGGLDSSIVTATAARLHPTGKIVAYTAVPRAGFQGGTPPGTVASEAHLAAATAKLYPNIEHVIIENSGESPLEGLDRNFLYHQQPLVNLANNVWGRAINRNARDRGANTLLKGNLGNLTMSYSGLEILPELLASGRWSTLIREAFKLARNGMPFLSLGAQTVGPFVPPPMWRMLRRLGGRHVGPVSFSAFNRDRFGEIGPKSLDRGFDLAGRPRRNPHESRLWAYARADGGNSYKGILAEWGLSIRDPSGDRRVIEYTLAAPIEEFLRDGVPRSLARRAFADRLPAEVIHSRVRGYQSADWHEALDRARPAIEEEVAAIARCAEAADALDLDYLHETIRSWPKDGWNRDDIRARYRLGLLRGIAAGHFMRKVRGTN